MIYEDKNHHLEISYTDPNNDRILKKEIIKIFTDVGHKPPIFKKESDKLKLTTFVIRSEIDLRYLLRKVEDCIKKHHSSIVFTYFH